MRYQGLAQSVRLKGSWLSWVNEQLSDQVPEAGAIADEGEDYPVLRNAKGDRIEWEDKYFSISWDKPMRAWMICPLIAPYDADIGIWFPQGGKQAMPRLLADRLAQPPIEWANSGNA